MKKKLADVAAAGAADVDAAVQAAARAFKTWRHSKGSERARYLRAIASGVDENKYFSGTPAVGEQWQAPD
ncbi:aldehyde dehydrogenase family protein [Undibacterium arcticum]